MFIKCLKKNIAISIVSKAESCCIKTEQLYQRRFFSILKNNLLDFGMALYKGKVYLFIKLLNNKAMKIQSNKLLSPQDITKLKTEFWVLPICGISIVNAEQGWYEGTCKADGREKRPVSKPYTCCIKTVQLYQLKWVKILIIS